MKKKLLTVDIWDTLIRRNNHPEFSKIETAKYVFSLHEITLKDTSISYFDIYKARLKVESDLAKRYLNEGFDDEYSIDEVFELWLKRISETNISTDLIDKLIKFEFNFEISNTYKDPTIIDTLKNFNAERMIFLSDFYMSSSYLNELLTHHNLIFEGYSSCDIRLNKRSGNLYKYILEKYNLDPSEQIHIGDNYYSDVEVPRRLGIESFHYEPELEHLKRLKKAVYFESFVSKD